VRDGSKNEMIPSGAGAFHSLYQLAAADPWTERDLFLQKNRGARNAVRRGAARSRTAAATTVARARRESNECAAETLMAG